MSMSVHVVGIRATDEKWRRMKLVYEACEVADVKIPEEVWDFFGNTAPDIRGIKVELGCGGDTCVKPYLVDCDKGFEVELAKLPRNLTHIRFYNSW